MTPYYVIAPPYDQGSAGSRVLYGLIDELNAAGCEAYAVLHQGWELASPQSERAIPYLTPEVAERHYKLRRTPVCVFPEAVREVATVGIRVMYALNVPGLLGGAAATQADLVYAYGRDLAARLPRADGVLFLPVSDPDYWCPDPTVSRIAPCVYEGKYVSEHGQALPDRLIGLKRIGRRSPGRDEVRRILRSSTHCYVFENTALATEAALCGCPVVFKTNAFFHGLLAAEELGTQGFTDEDTPEALARASREVGEFRRTYQRAVAAFPTALKSFVQATSALAVGCAPDRPFEVRPTTSRSGGPPRPSRPADPLPATVLDRLEAPASELDVALAYNVCLLREAESSAVLVEGAGRPLRSVIQALVGSPEFQDRIAAPLRVGAVAVDGRLFQTEALIRRWLGDLLFPARSGADGEGRVSGWRGLAAAVRADRVAYDRLLEIAGIGLDGPQLDQALDAIQRPALTGCIDQIVGGILSGWALDLAESHLALPLRVRLPAQRPLRCWTAVERPDVARRFGGGGRSGFVVSVPPVGSGSSVWIEHAETGQVIASTSFL